MNKWISVEDKLPDENQEVLILIPVVNRFNIENGIYRGKGIWTGAWCTRRGKGQNYNVTHWMPLPAMPESK